MADIEDDLEDEEGPEPGAPSQGQAGFNTAAVVAVDTSTSSSSIEPSNLTETSNAALLPNQPTGRSYDFLKTEGAERATAASASVTQPPLPSMQANSHPSYRANLTVMPMPELSNWQEVLCAHARLDAEGHPVDGGGKRIDLQGMNPEFGKRLAQTFLDLDAAGFKNYNVESGRRTVAEQTYLYNYYKSRGSSHPVALPGHSAHEWGLATDLNPPKGNEAAFFAAFHQLGAKNGLSFVENDPNHCQIPDAHNVIAQLREKQPIVMASNKTPAASPAGHSSKPLGMTA